MKEQRFMLATTQADGFTYDDYCDWCECNEVEPAPDESHEFYAWCGEQANMCWEDDMDNIECDARYNVPVICAGYLGLWDGRHPIYAKRFDSVRDAIAACMGRDIEQMDVEYVDGAIMVRAYHHDGTNLFEICALNKKGQAKVGVDYKPHDIKKLPYLYN